MSDKFSFFDVIAYVIPGTITLILAFRILHFYFQSSMNADFFFQWYGIVIIVLIGYIIGHIIQEAVKAVFRDRLYFSNKVLLSSNHHYSQNRKNQIISTFNKIFQDKSLEKAIHNIDGKKNNKIDKTIIKESFDLISTMVNQRKVAVSSEIFISLYYFCQGMLMTSVFWFIESIGELITQQPINKNTITQFTSPYVSWLLLICSLIAVITFYKRTKYFSRHYADSIYRSFICLGLYK